MMCRIFIAAAGANDTPMEAGWAFVVTEQIQLTGSAILQYCGCTKTTYNTALAMAALEAFYWLRAAKITDYIIYSPMPPETIFQSSLQRYFLHTFNRANVRLLPSQDVFSRLADSLAEKARLHTIIKPDLRYDDVQVADLVFKKEHLFSQRYIVLMKTETSNLIVLKNLTTPAHKLEVWNEDDFNKGGFITI